MAAVDSPPAATGGRRRVITTAVVVIVLVIAAGLLYLRAHRTGVKFSGMFTAAVGVYPGSQVRILGVQVGTIDSVTPEGQYVKIGMHLDPGVNATAGTGAVVIAPNLVSDRYVQLTGVYTRGPKLTDGFVIPPSRTRTPVELDDLYRSLISLTSALGPNGANKTGALSRALNVGARNLGGTGKDFNATIRNLSQATGTLAGARGNIFGTISKLSRFTTMLKNNNGALVTVNRNLASVTQTLADDRESFGAAMRNLGNSLSLVQNFIHTNRSLLSTNVARLSRVAGTLAAERASLSQALQAAPSLVDNFINAYDAKNKVLKGRADLNELTIWAKQAGAAGQSLSGRSLTSPTSGLATTPASTMPSGLLPSTNITTTNASAGSTGGGR